MKQHTKEAIEEFVTDLFFGSPEVTVTPTKKDRVDIEIKQMYEYVNCGLTELLAISKFFETTNIDDSRMYMNGCETCDYGSSYELTLTIRPEQSGETT